MNAPTFSRARFLQSLLLLPFVTKVNLIRSDPNPPPRTPGVYPVRGFWLGKTLEYDEDGVLLSKRVLGPVVQHKWWNATFEQTKPGDNPVDVLYLDHETKGRLTVLIEPDLIQIVGIRALWGKRSLELDNFQVMFNISRAEPGLDGLIPPPEILTSWQEVTYT